MSLSLTLPLPRHPDRLWTMLMTHHHSRELVAQSLLACAKEVGTAGLTFDVMDGKGTIQQELAKVVENKVDDWRG